ncbi:MAG: PLD nuclease N-terminal domain-containing protein [Sporichthyaceae bacterium]|nr:PLD nuclease N-terminal domain-containing protein [Sporichthyaceae bacterium]
MLPFVLFIAIWLYAVIDCILTPEDEARNLPKAVWMLIVVLAPLVGAICWLIFGRPGRRLRPGSQVRRPAGGSGYPRPTPRPVGPDDDPEFLRQLRRSNEEHEKLLRDWENNLKDREQDLRGKRSRKQDREDGRPSQDQDQGDQRQNGDGDRQSPTSPDATETPDNPDGPAT